MADETMVNPPEEGTGDQTELENYQFAEDEEGAEDTPEQEVVPEEPPPAQLTPDQIIAQAEERAFQRMTTWIGRRDKELFDHIDQKFNNVGNIQKTVIEDTEPASILDDPDGWAERKIRQLAPKVMYEEAERVSTADRNYTSTLIQSAGQIMDNDPLFSDKNFGNQVIAEIQQQFGGINKNLPPDVNAQLLINSAVTNLMRKGKGKGNALSGNTGINTPVGGVGPSMTPPKKAVNVPKLSPDAQRLAQRWNYKTEDLERVFKEH
jgi:hypothetical protein